VTLIQTRSLRSSRTRPGSLRHQLEWGFRYTQLCRVVEVARPRRSLLACRSRPFDTSKTHFIGDGEERFLKWAVWPGVMNLMTRHRVRHMPVLRGGNLAGCRRNPSMSYHDPLNAGLVLPFQRWIETSCYLFRMFWRTSLYCGGDCSAHGEEDFIGGGRRLAKRSHLLRCN
jgi:hypothetical protein